MSNNTNMPNNFRRPPMRPNPNMMRNSNNRIPPRPPFGPRPPINRNPNLRKSEPVNPNANNRQQSPSAQDMFESLTQAYNNMFSNLQLMNAVGIVNGIYQNATNLQNKGLNNLLQQEQFQQFLAQNNANNNSVSNQNLNSEEEKQKFFDEFYEYLIKKMSKDNIALNGNQPSEDKSSVVNKDTDVNIENDIDTNQVLREKDILNNQISEENKIDDGVESLSDLLVDEDYYAKQNPYNYNNDVKVDNSIFKDELLNEDKEEVVDENISTELEEENLVEDLEEEIETTESDSNEEDVELPIQEEQEEIDDSIENEVDNDKYAISEANKAGLNLVDYLNKETSEWDFEKFKPVEFEPIEINVSTNDFDLVNAKVEDEGEFVEIQDYEIEELEDALSKVKQNNATDSEEDLSEDKQEMLNKEMQELDNEIKQIEESLSKTEINQDLPLEDSNSNEDDEELLDSEDSTYVEQEESNSNVELNDNNEDENINSEEFEFDEPEEVEFDDEELEEETQENKITQTAITDAVLMNELNGILDDEDDNEENIDQDVEDDEDFSDIIIDESGEGLINHTMTSKVLNADEDIQEIYNDIKNYLLSYKGIKSRFSSACESYRLSRKLMAKFVIIGRTIKLYLALDPEEFPNNIYHQKDESKKKAYIDVPFMVKIKSGLSIRKAKELIDKLMAKNDIVRNSRFVEKDYIKELIEKEEE